MSKRQNKRLSRGSKIATWLHDFAPLNEDKPSYNDMYLKYLLTLFHFISNSKHDIMFQAHHTLTFTSWIKYPVLFTNLKDMMNPLYMWGVSKLLTYQLPQNYKPHPADYISTIKNSFCQFVASLLAEPISYHRLQGLNEITV